MKKNIIYLNVALLMLAVVLGVNTFSASGHELIRSALAAVGSITGEGTVNFIARFATGANPSNVIGDSIIYDDGAGKVGIGTTTPNVPLHVKGGNGGTVRLESSGAEAALLLSDSSGQAGELKTSGANVIFNAPIAGGSILFVTQGVDTQGIYIKAGGNVGIGTTTPGAKLEVSQSNVGGFADVLHLYNPSTNTASSVGMTFSYGQTGDTTSGLGRILGYVANTGNNGGGLKFQTRDGGTGNINTAITILDNQFVGIGTMNPGAPLHVVGAAEITGALQAGGSSVPATYSRIGTGNSPAGLTGANELYINGRLEVQGATYIAGNVGIGTTGPQGKLDVSGNLIVGADGNVKIGGGLLLAPRSSDPPNLTNGMMWMVP